MKTFTMKANPAFKRTQPLPLLSADFAQHAGWAARSLASVLPLGGDWRQAAGALPLTVGHAPGPARAISLAG